MPRVKVSEWSQTASANTDINSIDINEGCAPSSLNNAIREAMAQIKDMQLGADGDNFAVGGNLSVTGTSALTGATTVSGVLTASSGVAGNVTGNVTGNVSGTAANVTGIVAVANGGTGVSSLGTGVVTFLGTPTSANLAAAVTNETGSGSLVFATSPTLVTPVLGTPSSGTLTSCTGLPLTTGVTGTLPVANGGTGVATITGIVKGSGTTALSAATAGTDYSAGTSALDTGIVKSTTTTGALTIAVAADFPTLNQNTTGTSANVTGTVAVANGGTGLTAVGTSGNVLKSNGTIWTSSAPATSITTTSGTAPYFGARAFASFSTVTLADISATYTQNNGSGGAGTIVTLTVSSHAYQVGHQIYVDIATTGTSIAVDGLYVVTAVTATTITYTAGTSLLTSGNATIKQCSIYTGSQNVANVVFQSTGEFIINFTTAMPFANYSAIGSCGLNNGGTFTSGDDNMMSFGCVGRTGIRTTQSIRGFTTDQGGVNYQNVSLNSVIIFA